MPDQVRVVGRADPPVDDLFLQFPMPDRGKGSFGSFLGRCSDGKRRWLKTLNNPQDKPKTLVAEFISAKLGALIGAPVCEVRPVRIKVDHVGFEFAPGRTLEEGFASGSLDVLNAAELRSLEHRHSDDNRRRHVGIFANWDWCFGEDRQWLYDGSADNATWSHDHGLFLWHGEISGPGLATPATTPATTRPGDPSGLDTSEVATVATSLRAVTAAQIGEVMRSVPASWPATDDELERLGNVLLERAPKVAQRLEAMAGP